MENILEIPSLSLYFDGTLYAVMGNNPYREGASAFILLAVLATSFTSEPGQWETDAATVAHMTEGEKGGWDNAAMMAMTLLMPPSSPWDAKAPPSLSSPLMLKLSEMRVTVRRA